MIVVWSGLGNQNYSVKVRERPWPWFKENNFDRREDTNLSLLVQSHTLQCQIIHPDLREMVLSAMYFNGRM